MERVIEYESLNEEILYSLLEIDRRTVRYYVQPVGIDMRTIDNEGKIKDWVHTPDVLIYRNGSSPLLYQIKEYTQEQTAIFSFIDKKCKIYAQNKNWIYNKVYPKQLPKRIIKNIELLSGFTKKRYYYDSIIPELINTLQVLGNTTIENLSKSFSYKMPSLMVKPAIYYLIAHDEIRTDMFQEINQYSPICLSDGSDILLNYFGDESYEISGVKNK